MTRLRKTKTPPKRNQTKLAGSPMDPFTRAASREHAGGARRESGGVGHPPLPGRRSCAEMDGRNDDGRGPGKDREKPRGQEKVHQGNGGDGDTGKPQVEETSGSQPRTGRDTREREVSGAGDGQGTLGAEKWGHDATADPRGIQPHMATTACGADCGPSNPRDLNTSEEESDSGNPPTRNPSPRKQNGVILTQNQPKMGTWRAGKAVASGPRV